MNIINIITQFLIISNIRKLPQLINLKSVDHSKKHKFAIKNTFLHNWNDVIVTINQSIYVEF